MLVNSTSTMPVQLTKLVMSASVTVRPMVRKRRPTGRSSKWKPSPTVSMLGSYSTWYTSHDSRAAAISRSASSASSSRSATRRFAASASFSAHASREA